MRALTPDSGSVMFSERGVATDVLALEGDALKRFRRQVQFIFQDPFGSLNPRMSVYDIVAEPLVIHGIGNARSRQDMVAELITLVGLDVRDLRRYPHSFSGGQRQRIGIARALALRPELVICDEPVSALDVSIQAQILNLLIDLQKKLGLTYLFVSHNLAVVDYIADRIAVMCGGRIVELAPREHLVGGDEPQLLGDEADRDRQQRVEVVEAARRVLVPQQLDGDEHGVGEREALPGAHSEPELAARRKPVPARRSKEPDEAVRGGHGQRSPDRNIACAHRPPAGLDIERFATK